MYLVALRVQIMDIVSAKEYFNIFHKTEKRLKKTMKVSWSFDKVWIVSFYKYRY